MSPEKKKHVLWTAEDTQTLKRLIKEKSKAISDIANELGRTEKAIRRKCDKIGYSSSTVYKKQI
jgi:hypothetical protein